MSKQRPFAVFDIDGTVIRWQLYHAIVSELGNRGFIPQISAEDIRSARMTWKKRSHASSFSEYEHRLVHAHHKALSTVKVSDFLDVVNDVFEEHKDQVYTYTRDLIKSLKEQGYLLFTISGSQQEIIEKLAEYYGFDDYIGNQYERRNGYFTGKSTGVVDKKGQLLEELVAKHNASYAGSIAVGDSESDIPMFDHVERPIVFNPTAGLLAAARAKGWDIVVERKSVVFSLQASDGQYYLQ